MATKNYTQKDGGANRNNKGVLLHWRKNREAAVPQYWSEVNERDLVAAIDAITRGGGAIMLGITADGGAYSICVLAGDDKVKEYPHGAEECNETLRALAAEFTEALL